MKNKILTALLSLVIAFGIWTYVVTVVKPDSEETFYNIPVVLQGEGQLTERQLMLISGESSTVTLKLHGNRMELNKLKSSDITVTADLSRIYEPGTHRLNYNVSFPSDNTYSVQNREPSRITVEVAKRTSKNVDVRVQFAGAVPEGYLADKGNPVLDIPQVSVTGPEEVIDLIDHARVDVDLTGRVESVSENLRITLCDQEDNPVDVQLVEVSTEEVHLEVKIQKQQEVTLEVTLVDGGGATKDTCRCVISPSIIWISGSEAALADLQTLNIGTINLAEITEDTERTFEIVLPEGITNVSNVSKATVSISFPKLRTRKFTVTNIVSVNVPEGMQASLLTAELSVSIRGPRAKVDAMKLEDISVTVDFAKEAAGTATLPAVVVLGSGFEDCGALGSYSVTATLKPMEDANASNPTQ